MNYIKEIFNNHSSVNFKDSTVRYKYGTFCAVFGIICNLILFGVKLTIGIIGQWISVIADALNNLSDAGSSVVGLVGFKLAKAPPDKKHPFGHGRIEYIASFMVSMIIIFMGYELVRSSIESIFVPSETNFDIISVSVLLASIGVKLLMFFINKETARKIDSELLKATALESLGDVLATVAVVIGLLLTHFTGIYIDGFMSILVSGFIIYTGIVTIRESINLLLGEAPSEELVQQIKSFLLSYDNVYGMHSLIINNYGANRSIISVHLEIPCNMNAMDMHNMVDNIENEFEKKFSNKIVIHMDPIVADDEKLNKIKTDVLRIANSIDESIYTHDYRLIKSKNYYKLMFIAVVPPGFNMSDDELKQEFTNRIKEIVTEDYKIVISIQQNYAPI